MRSLEFLNVAIGAVQGVEGCENAPHHFPVPFYTPPHGEGTGCITHSIGRMAHGLWTIAHLGNMHGLAIQDSEVAHKFLATSAQVLKMQQPQQTAVRQDVPRA